MARIFDRVAIESWLRDEIVQKVPRGGLGDIRLGSPCIVNPGETALFIRGGESMGTLTPGTHVLTTANVPWLTDLLEKGLFGGKNVFTADVYYVKTTDMTLKWGTANPIIVEHQGRGPGASAMVGNGTYVVRVKDACAILDSYGCLPRKRLNSKPAMDGSRIVTSNPISRESDLNYLDWVSGNRKRVTEMTKGKVGYLHIPDMGGPGIREFIKWYYGQTRKDGLVVDVRANGGGNVSRMIIERLRRKLLAVNFSRTDDVADSYPDGVFIGPMAAILDERSSSDGDIFPAMFKQAGLGPLIGRRSWGGVVGISGRGPLIDGGGISVPESGMANTKWSVNLWKVFRQVLR